MKRKFNEGLSIRIPGASQKPFDKAITEVQKSVDGYYAWEQKEIGRAHV